MNIDRLRLNTPVLVKVIREEYKISYELFSMIFKVKPKTIVNWEFGAETPDEDMVNAMILAYQWVKYWKPKKLLLPLAQKEANLTFQENKNFWGKVLVTALRATDHFSQMRQLRLLVAPTRP